MMRKKSILQFLIANPFRLVSRRHCGMVVFNLSAPTPQQLKDAREHLRYWPYVKAFRLVDETHMKVIVFIGRGIPDTRWGYYVKRSCDLMNQCVRQYQALFVMTNENEVPIIQQYHSNTFLRPDDLLKPFCDFIDELQQ